MGVAGTIRAGELQARQVEAVFVFDRHAATDLSVAYDARCR